MSLFVTRATSSVQSQRIPTWVKIAYTAFVAVLVSYYLQAYGPTNFLYFCDVALLMGLVALWTEKSLWASVPTVGILFPQVLWCVDFLGGLIGWPITGMTNYMFNPSLCSHAACHFSIYGWLTPLILPANPLPITADVCDGRQHRERLRY